MIDTPTFDQLPLALTVEEASKILRIGRNKAYDLVRCGKLPALRIGKLIRIPRNSLVAYLQHSD